MLRFLPLFILLPLVFLSCSDELIETSPSTGKLEFSRDTVFLDTVFSSISSSTRSFKVYNRSKNNIIIPSIGLERGESSFYRLSVDGIPGKSFENIVLLARDSLYVFVEATIDHSMVSDPLYTDAVLFDQGSGQQEVKLVTLVQDAHFLYPERNSEGVKERIVLGVDDAGEEISVEGFYLDGDVVWGRDKPYVIYGYAGVRPGKTLTIRKGARVYFHANSGILVEKGGTLRIKGTLEDKVILEGDRLESFYAETPGQWGTIWLRAGSRDHEIDHALIRNNTLGLLVDSIGDPTEPTLRLRNTEIYNTSNFGLLGRSAHIRGENLVIGNNGQSALACLLGGTYSFTHCTFANFWQDGIRVYPAVLLSNFLKLRSPDGSESTVVGNLDRADLINCIVDGNQGIEFLLQKDPSAGFSYYFANSLLRFDDLSGKYREDPLYDFENNGQYKDIILNGAPDLLLSSVRDLRIGEASDGIGRADAAAARRVPFDLLGNLRTLSPDIGAYQHISEEGN